MHRLEAWARDGGWRKPEVRIVNRDRLGRFNGTNRLVNPVVRPSVAKALFQRDR